MATQFLEQFGNTVFMVFLLCCFPVGSPRLGCWVVVGYGLCVDDFFVVFAVGNHCDLGNNYDRNVIDLVLLSFSYFVGRSNQFSLIVATGRSPIGCDCTP